MISPLSEHHSTIFKVDKLPGGAWEFFISGFTS